MQRASPAPGRAPGADAEAALKNLFRALIAGYGAKKLGGGCISTILIFLLLYWLLGVVF